jgi:hypothetical protein
LGECALASYATLTQWNAQTIADHVRNDGIVVLDRFFPSDKLDLLNREFRELYASIDQPGVRSHSQTASAHALTLDPDKLDRSKFSALPTIADDPVLRGAAEVYFGKPIIYPHKLFATWLRGTERPVPQLPSVPHTDRFQMFKYMVYLHDVSAEGGAMAVAPGYHNEFAKRRLAWIKSGKPYQERPNILSGMDKILEPVEASAGSVLVFDTDMPHRAGHVHLGLERHTLRIDVVCPAYAGTMGKQSWLDRLFSKPVVAD